MGNVMSVCWGYFSDEKKKEQITNINHQVTEEKPQNAAVGQSDDPVAVLERRQENILQRLSELKNMVEKLSCKYDVGVSSPQPDCVGSSVSATQIQDLGNEVLDIVIGADPQYPPLSLFILYQLLKQKYKVKGTCHVHSSVSNVTENLTNIFKSDNERNGENRSNHQIILTLIWKKVEYGPTLMVSPHNQVVIQGEVNIARYLTRLLDPNYQTANIAQATQVDEWLDTVQKQYVTGNTKEKASIIKSLNVKLGSSSWLVGSSFSLADIVTWSTLHQYRQTTDVPGNVKKWLTACNQQKVFKQVQCLL